MEAPQFWTGGVWIKRVLDGPIRTERKKSQSLLYQSTPQRQRPKAERVEVEGQVRNSIHDFFPLFFRFSSLCFCSSLKSRVGLGFWRIQWPCQPLSPVPNWRLCCSIALPLQGHHHPLSPNYQFSGNQGRASFKKGLFVAMLRVLRCWLRAMAQAAMLPPSPLLSSSRLLQLIVSLCLYASFLGYFFIPNCRWMWNLFPSP